MKKEPINKLSISSLSDVELQPKVHEVLKYLASQPFQVVLIGGFVRDLARNVLSKDLDFIVVGKSTVHLGNDLETKFAGNSFVLDEETQTVRFVFSDEDLKEFTFDFTPVKAGKLDEDFERRDFTINAIGIDLKEQDMLIDPFDGLRDIKNKTIKAIKLKNLIDDPLRFLRAFRFAALLKGEIDGLLFLFIKENINKFDDSVSPERISVELWKIFEIETSFEYIRLFTDVGLLEKIIPELTPCRKVPANDHHHLPLFDHSIELVKTFEEHYLKIPVWAQEFLNKPLGGLGTPKIKSVTKLASILHDIGKPDTWEIKTIDGNEKHTFYGHDKVGEDLVKNIGGRLRFSNSITRLIAKLVRYHLRPFQLSQNDAQITSKALYRFFRDLGDATVPLLMLSLADMHATRGPKVTANDLVKRENLILFLFDEYAKYMSKEEEKAKKQKLLDGNEIMKLTGLKPSRALGDIINDLDEAIGIGEIQTKEEAKEWVLKKVRTL